MNRIFSWDLNMISKFSIFRCSKAQLVDDWLGDSTNQIRGTESDSGWFQFLV